MASTQTKPTLGYWKIRGLAEPIRRLAAYLKIDIDEKQYTSMEEYQKDVPTLKLEFTNLPYLFDGETGVTESDAIMVYLVTKSGNMKLLGKTPTDTYMVAGAFKDIHRDTTMLCYSSKTVEELKKALEEKYQSRRFVNFLDKLEARLAKGDFVLGELSYLDFSIAEFIEKQLVMDEEIGTKTVSGRPVLKSYVERFVNLEGVKEYVASERALKRPYNGWVAIWH